MWRMSFAYFLAFSVTVPLASYLLVYGLYQLRTYLLESARTAKELARQNKPTSKLYDSVQTMVREKAKPFDSSHQSVQSKALMQQKAKPVSSSSHSLPSKSASGLMKAAKSGSAIKVAVADPKSSYSKVPCVTCSVWAMGMVLYRHLFGEEFPSKVLKFPPLRCFRKI